MGKGIRQNRFVTLGKELALEIGSSGLLLEVLMLYSCCFPQGLWLVVWRQFGKFQSVYIYIDIACRLTIDLELVRTRGIRLSN